jgi:hypothetical protein
MGALQKAARWSRWFPDRVTHLTGLIPVVEANKAAFMRGMMSYLNDLKGTDWAALPDRVRNKMTGYGLDERDWKIMQMARPYTPSIGSANWLRPNEVVALGTERPEDVLRTAGFGDLINQPGQNSPGLNIAAAERAQNIAYNTALKMLTYMHGEREVAVPQSSMWVRAKLLGSTHPGTFWGEMARSAGMFKGFIGSMMLTQMQAMQRELIGNRYKGAAYIASFFIVMSLMGMVSLQLGQIATGKDMLPFNLGTWLRAILKSGSFGIFGDFVASDVSSFGRGILETGAGPAIMLPLDMLQGSFDLIRNTFSGRNHKPWNEIVSDRLQTFLRSNTPILSTAWPVRAAYDRIVLHQLQYLMDREAHYKQAQHAQRTFAETGQHFWWDPTEMLPHRMPRLTEVP